VQQEKLGSDGKMKHSISKARKLKLNIVNLCDLNSANLFDLTAARHILLTYVVVNKPPFECRCKIAALIVAP